MWNFFLKNNTSVFLKIICIATQSKPVNITQYFLSVAPVFCSEACNFYHH